MDFNVNGIVDRNDAFLLSRAIFDLVRFTEPFQVILPDHNNQSSECAFRIDTKLRFKNGDPASEENTQTFFEIANRNSLLKQQLHETGLGNGVEMVASYNGQNGLFGGIFKAHTSSNGAVTLAFKQSELHILNLGLSMIQVTQTATRSKFHVSPLFTYSRVPEYNASLDIRLTADSRLLSKGHSPQLSINITESTSSCLDPWITKTVRLTFENEFSTVKDKENIFIDTFILDLSNRFLEVKIESVRLVPGSILVYFNVLARQSQCDSLLVSMWDVVKSGYTLHVDGVEFKAQKAMQVNNVDYYGLDGPPRPKATVVSSFPVAAVVSGCVAAVIIVLVVVFYLTYRKRMIRTKEGFRFKTLSKVNILGTRSTSRSDQNGDTELTVIGHINAHFESSDDELFPSTRSPRTTGRSSLSPLIDRKMRRVESASSQVSVEAWTDRTPTPTLKRLKLHSGQNTPENPSPFQSPAIQKKLRKSLSAGHISASILRPDSSSTEGTPLNISPAIQRKIRMTHQSSQSKLIGGYSSEEDSHSPHREQNGGSMLVSGVAQSKLFERAVLHKQLQKTGSSSK